MAKLGDVCTLIRNGASIKQTEGAGGFPITRIETIANREVDRNKFGYANILDIAKYESYILQDGDILMSHINSEKHLGKVALYKKQGNERIIHGMNLLLLRANSKILLPSYAAYYFETPSFLGQIQRITKKSVNQASFTVTALKEVEIPLPSLDNQRHIAAVLDKVTDLIAQRRAQLDKLDLLVKSRFVEMFGDCNYPRKPLIDLIVEGAGLSYGIVQPGNDGTGDMGVIRPVDLVDGKISMESIKHIDRSIGDAFKKTELTGDELLITVRGTTGITALSNHDCTGMNVTRGIAVVRYDRNKINPVYLNTYLNTDESQNYIQEHTRGATLQQINLSDLRILQILVPPMSQQIQLGNFVNNMTKLKETIAASINMLEVLKSSLMQQYFRGK